MTPGGRGGKVYVVTTLDWDGPGSFSEALFKTEPRTIVFRVSGVIDVPSGVPGLEEAHSFVTIAGQTSPGGITFRITQDPPLISYKKNFHDAVIRFLRFRGKDAYDVFSFNDTHDFIVDHCDFSGASDETFDVTFSHDFTVQWSTIANSGPTGQVYGALIAYSPTSRISMHHNLNAHHNGRCGAHLHWNDAGAPVDGALFDYRNNVNYNCNSGYILEIAEPISGIAKFNLVGNYSKDGPDTQADSSFIGSFSDVVHVYHADNVYGSHKMFTEWSDPTLESVEFTTVVPVATESAENAYQSVLGWVGAWPRDPMTARTVEEVETGTGTIGKVDDPLITTGPEPPPDADLDGMSDDWETAHGLAPNDPADSGLDPDGDGYTHLEDYLNELAIARIGQP